MDVSTTTLRLEQESNWSLPTTLEEAKDGEEEDFNNELPSGLKLFVVFLSLVLSILLVALDTTIIATAIPKITDEFQSLDQVGWFGSAYFLTCAAFQSFWGKTYTYFGTKTTFTIGIAFFEFGTLICALAQNSTMFIAGRAVSGFGGAALANGAFSIVAEIASPKKRPIYIGFMGATFGVASVIGPLLGGYFTEYTQGMAYSGWRWCFWINIPIGACASSIVLMFFKPPPSRYKLVPLKDKIFHMDLFGVGPLLAAMVCFLLPMRWGGVILPWNSGQVIGVLEGCIICLLLFIMIEWRSGEKAMMQWRLFKNYQILLNLIYVFFLAGLYMPAVYFVSIQFQAIENKSPAGAGLKLIPLVLCVSLGTIIANTSISKFGRPGIWQCIGPILGTAGALMIYKLGVNADTKSWVLFQIILGFGVGFSLQTPMSVNQSLVHSEDIPIIVGMTLFFEMCGASFLIAACEAAFANQLVFYVGDANIAIDPVSVIESGASELRNLFSSKDLDAVLTGYQQGLNIAYLVMFASGCATIAVSVLLLLNRSSRSVLLST